MPMTEEQLEARDAKFLAEPDPERIWLQAKCASLSEPYGRCWMETPENCDDADCEMKAVEYIRADLVLTMKPASRR